METNFEDKVVFLDRDGVINKKPPEGDYVKKWEEFEFLPRAIEAMKLFSQNGYRIFIVTNQRGIARGLMAKEDLEEIHDHMKEELSRHDISLEAIYHCPHNFQDNCNCRKPKPGMFHQAAKEYVIDLTKATMIGDSVSDMEAGSAAGCKTILVNEKEDLLHAAHTILFA